MSEVLLSEIVDLLTSIRGYLITISVLLSIVCLKDTNGNSRLDRIKEYLSSINSRLSEWERKYENKEHEERWK